MPELNGLKNPIASPQKKFFIPFMHSAVIFENFFRIDQKSSL